MRRVQIRIALRQFPARRVLQRACEMKHPVVITLRGTPGRGRRSQHEALVGNHTVRQDAALGGSGRMRRRRAGGKNSRTQEQCSGQTKGRTHKQENPVRKTE